MLDLDILLALRFLNDVFKFGHEREELTALPLVQLKLHNGLRFTPSFA